MDILTIVMWLIVGGLAGLLGSKLTGTDSEVNGIMNVVVGVIGAFIGGFVMNLFGGQGYSGFNLWSIFVAILGSVVLLSLYKMLSPRV